MPESKGLEVKDLSLVPGGTPFDAFVAPGSITGLAGLDGHGQDEFLEVLAGLRKPAGGQVHLVGTGLVKPVAGFRNAAANGIAYMPRDRRLNGIFPNLSVLDNFAISSLGRDVRAFGISLRNRRRRYEQFRDALSIVARNPELPITSLSGGNQQKVLLARLLAREPDILLLNDPTRGVDVVTRRALDKVFRDLAASGMALVILSSEIEEAVSLCDSLLVFREQSLHKSLSGPEKTIDRALAAMFGRNR